MCDTLGLAPSRGLARSSSAVPELVSMQYIPLDRHIADETLFVLALSRVYCEPGRASHIP